ncbi:broad-complex core protein isoforms 1/2/3/4/5 [Sergentomyia squamirostris]
MPQPNCQSIRYCWEAEKVKTLIRLRAELSPLFTGKRNAAKYAWAVVERELNVPLPLAKIIKKWNNLLQEYKAIKLSEEPKRRDWPFFNMMDVYFSDQVNDPTLRLFSSTKTFGADNLDDCTFEDSIVMTNAIAAATAAAQAASREARENAHAAENMMQQDTKSVSSHDDSDSTKPSTASMTAPSTTSTPVSNSYNNGISSREYEELMESKYAEAMQQQKDVSAQELLQQAEHHNIDQYLLSWNNFYGNMCRGFHSLQKDGQMVDVTIAAGGKIFKAHKLVLSVCSPYFQKIFLEHPSTHPILFMTDVHSNHMAGLLDFMYSGQVNVKYEDLPNFLKVAEAMQIKGLHSESTTDNDDQGKHSTTNNNNNNNSNANSNSKQFKHPSYPGVTNLSMADNFQHRQSVPTSTGKSPGFNPRSTPPSSLSPALAASRLYQHPPTPPPISAAPKYQIHSTSKTMLDNQKHQKYFSKRKMTTPMEIISSDKMDVKRNRLAEDSNKNYKAMPLTDDDLDERDSDRHVKPEPEPDNDRDTPGPQHQQQSQQQDEEVYYADSPTGAAAAAIAATAKLKHSILESHLRQNENSALAGKLNFQRQSS